MFTYHRRQYSEKRDYMRMVMNCPATFNEVDEERMVNGTCVNLSAKGVLISTHVYFPAGTLLEVHVQPSLSKSPTFDAVVEVVRVDQPADSRMFGLGARIIEIL